MNSLQVLIVNYRQFDLCLRCIESIQRCGLATESDITVVDNDSRDGSALRLSMMFPEARIVVESINRGYAAGINRGMAEIGSEFVLILNPDTYFIENTAVAALVEFRAEVKLGMIGLNLLNTDMTPQNSGRRFYSALDVLVLRSPLKRLKLFEKRLSRHYMLTDSKEGRKYPDWVMGTGIILRRAAFLDVCGMDESYFLYFEDVDLCARLWLKGWRIALIAGMTLVHDHQRSSAKSLFSRASLIHLSSMLRFARKFSLPLISGPSVESLISASNTREVESGSYRGQIEGSVKEKDL